MDTARGSRGFATVVLVLVALACVVDGAVTMKGGVPPPRDFKPNSMPMAGANVDAQGGPWNNQRGFVQEPWSVNAYPLPPWGYVNVLDAPYNATGDGTTDDTAAIQAALTDVGNSGGGIVFLPQGNYYISGSLTIPTAVVLKGVASHVMRNWGDPSVPRVVGTTLLAVNTDEVFISLAGDNAGVEGLNIFYPNQVAGANPVGYPWTIQGGSAGASTENLFVRNVLLVNPYQGIDFGSNECPRHWISNVYGQPLMVGIQVDQCYDIGRIEHIHFWPFWSSDPDLLNFINNKAFTFVFYRSDWEVVHDVFSWGYHVGMLFRNSSFGALNGQFSNINFDNVDVGIDVYITQPYGIFFSNLNLANAGGGSARVGILGETGGNGNVFVRGASFWGQFTSNIEWTGSGMISISDSYFNAWSNAAISIQAGRAMINNNFFQDSVGVAISSGQGADRIIITNNQLAGNSMGLYPIPHLISANNMD